MRDARAGSDRAKDDRVHHTRRHRHSFDLDWAVTYVSRIVTADRYAGGIRMRLARFSFAQSNQSDHATTRALAYLFDVDDQRF
jgi:hypothetical protein